MLTQVWSPYQLNPSNYHPLRELLQRIDFERLRDDASTPRVFICATNVRTGLRRVFRNSELSADVLLASACLPQLYQAVQIGDDLYWDGGYTGNPALAPLYLGTSATDLIVVGINPMERTTVPATARGISDRIDEISFDSTFMLELGAIVLATAISMTLVVQWWLQVPIAGSPLLFLSGACIYVITVAALGIALGTVAATMAQFGLLSIPVLLVMMLLSGSTTPMESMPVWLQYLMNTISPTPHFVVFAQDVLYRGAGLSIVWREIAAMSVIGTVYFGFALYRFRRVIFSGS